MADESKKLRKWEKNYPGFGKPEDGKVHQLFDMTHGSGAEKDSWLGRYSAFLDDDRAKKRTRELERRRVIVVIFERQKNGEVVLTPIVARASFVSDGRYVLRNGIQSAGRFLLYPSSFGSTDRKKLCEDSKYPSPDMEYLEYEIAYWPEGDKYSEDYDTMNFVLTRLRKGEKTDTDEEERRRSRNPSVNGCRAKRTATLMSKGIEPPAKKPAPSTIQIITVPDKAQLPEKSDNRVDWYESEEEPEVPLENDDGDKGGVNDTNDDRRDDAQEQQADTSATAPLEVVNTPGRLSGHAAGRVVIVGSASQSARQVVRLNDQSSPVFSSKIMLPDGPLTDWSVMEKLLRGSTGGKDTLMYISKQIHDQHQAQMDLLKKIYAGVRGTDPPSAVATGAVPGDKISTVPENARWRLDPWSYAPLSTLPVANKTQLLALNAALNVEAVRENVKEWLWTLFYATKNTEGKEAYRNLPENVKNMACVNFCMNALVGRFDCVLEVTGQYAANAQISDADQRKRPLDGNGNIIEPCYKMLHHEEKIGNIRELIHELRVKAFGDKVAKTHEKLTSKEMSQPQQSATDTKITEWFKLHRNSMQKSLGGPQKRVFDQQLIEPDLVVSAAKFRAAEWKKGGLRAYLLYLSHNKTKRLNNINASNPMVEVQQLQRPDALQPQRPDGALQPQRPDGRNPLFESDPRSPYSSSSAETSLGTGNEVTFEDFSDDSNMSVDQFGSAYAGGSGDD